MVLIRKNIRLLFVLFVPVYFFIAHSSLQNRHSHISANGIIIVHSHPVNHTSNEPLNAHDHSNSEICFYHLVQFDYFSHSPEIQFLSESYLQLQNYFIPDEQWVRQFLEIHHLSRGPPMV